MAVRKSGRVRVHKARENSNGSFSIGKTWLLDDLTTIQSFTGTPIGPNGEQYNLWAGPTGFIVTLGKSYYWKANSQKEKQFFIASLLKIYHKYTGGKIPDLIGFDTVENDQLSGALGSSRSVQSGTPVSNSNQYKNRNHQNDATIQIDSAGDVGQHLPPSPSGDTSAKRPQARIKGDSSYASNTDLNTSSGSIPLKPSFTRLISSQNQQSPIQNENAPYSSSHSFENHSETSYQSEKLQDLGTTTSLYRSFPGEGNLMSRIKKRSDYDLRSLPAPLSLATEMKGSPQSRGGSRERLFGYIKNAIPAPLKSPSMKHEGAPRSRSIDGIKKNENYVVGEEPGSISNSIQNKGLDRNPSSSNLKINDQVQSEVVRQGPGPAIKPSSIADVNETFDGTTNVLNSLKPRAGGVLDRLKDLKKISHEDLNTSTGIAPGQWLLQNNNSKNSLASNSPNTDKQLPREYEEKLEPQAFTLQPEPLTQDQVSLSPVNDTNEDLMPILKKKIKPSTDRVTKELASLGIDPLILAGRSSELKNAWEQFGWVRDGMRTKNIEEMKDEVERELNRIQTGGWLSRLEEDNEKIDAIKIGFDKVAEECDELNGLLTLYLVELGVSGNHSEFQ